MFFAVHDIADCLTQATGKTDWALCLAVLFAVAAAVFLRAAVCLFRAIGKGGNAAGRVWLVRVCSIGFGKSFCTVQRAVFDWLRKRTLQGAGLCPAALCPAVRYKKALCRALPVLCFCLLSACAKTSAVQYEVVTAAPPAILLEPFPLLPFDGQTNEDLLLYTLSLQENVRLCNERLHAIQKSIGKDRNSVGKRK